MESLTGSCHAGPSGRAQRWIGAPPLLATVGRRRTHVPCDRLPGASGRVDVETVAVLRKRWISGGLTDQRFSAAIDDLEDLDLGRCPEGDARYPTLPLPAALCTQGIPADRAISW